MASVLRAPEVGSSRLLHFSHALPPDPEWERRLAEHEADAHARGVEDGRRQAVAELSATVEALRAAVVEAAERAGREVRSQVRADAETVVALALELAECVTGTVPLPSVVLVERIDAALAVLDGADFVVDVHPAEAEFVADALADPRCTVRAASDLKPGEARVSGEWGDADLTRQTAWTVLREAFDAG